MVILESALLYVEVDKFRAAWTIYEAVSAKSGRLETVFKY